MVIIYKLAPLTYALAKRLVKVKHIGLCNIVAGETVIQELIQDEASPEKIAVEINSILNNQEYGSIMINKLAEIRSKLGCGGASQNVAKLIISMMEVSCLQH
jgi:lipid-A-disaccharide synthase